MDTGVREILVKALTMSARNHQLAADREDRFARIVRTTDYSMYSVDYQSPPSPSQQYVEDVCVQYTPVEILAILAVARFEGILEAGVNEQRAREPYIGTAVQRNALFPTHRLGS
jgi:hypothetical protein